MPISGVIGGGYDPTPTVSTPETKNEVGVSSDVSDIEPIESSTRDGVILEALGISDNVGMPGEDTENLGEVGKYITELIEKKGLTPTRSVYKRMVGEVIDEMGIDKDTEPSKILDRVGGMVKAWRDIVFIKDPAERRSIFMRLARLNSSKEMNDLVYKKMQEKQVWL